MSQAPIERERFDAARDLLVHRGPDSQQSTFLDADKVALGHTRLSIIDLSSQANQPMHSDNLWVVFNGEIYNHLELRAELEAQGAVFQTSSDTEVLLHGYRLWQKDLCRRLEGMFAFAIWDDQAKQMFLGRDHFGQKPMYYGFFGSEFVAASEIKAIKGYLRNPPRIRREAVIDMLVHDFVPEPNTWFEGIQALPAGHQMLVKRDPTSGQLHSAVEEYWDFRPDPDPRPVCVSQALEGMTEQIDRAIRSHLIADVEVGAFLSGGIDSSAIATLAAQQLEHPLKTFSIGFERDDELPAARETARRIAADHQEGSVSEEDFRAALSQVLDIFDHPFTDTSLVPMSYVSELASRQVKVVLTGDGGDECFGGYDYGKYLGLRPTLQTGDLKSFARSVVHTSTSLWRGTNGTAAAARAKLFNIRSVSAKRASLLSPELLQNCAEYDPSWAYRAHQNPALDGFRDAQWIGIKVPLVNKMLVKVDRCAMRHSLETRAPFLAPRLVEYMLNLPRPVANPDSVPFKGLFRSWLKGTVRDDVLNGAKRGFSVPGNWSQIDEQRFKAGQELFPKAVEAGLLRAGAWQSTRNLPKHQWRFAQLEHGLSTGLLEA